MQDDIDNDMVFYKKLWDKNLSQHLPESFDLQAYYDAGVIRKEDLVDGAYYRGHCRNARVAKWDAKKNCFKYMRDKWGHVFAEDINHLTDDNGFDLFIPFAKVDIKDVEDDAKVK